MILQWFLSDHVRNMYLLMPDVEIWGNLCLNTFFNERIASWMCIVSCNLLKKAKDLKVFLTFYNIPEVFRSIFPVVGGQKKEDAGQHLSYILTPSLWLNMLRWFIASLSTSLVYLLSNDARTTLNVSMESTKSFNFSSNIQTKTYMMNEILSWESNFAIVENSSDNRNNPTLLATFTDHIMIPILRQSA